MPKKVEPSYIIPSLESITVKGKYLIRSGFDAIEKKLREALEPHLWKVMYDIGESITLLKRGDKWPDHIERLRAGTPTYLSVIVIEHSTTGVLVEIECRPAMWFKISTLKQSSFTENEVQEALFESRSFVKQVMSIFKAKEVEPISVYPIIERMKIRSRLQNLGLKRIVKLLGKAEKHIVQNNFTDSLKSSRTAFEKMIDWQMKKRGLDETNNYRNNLERLKSKGYLDSHTTELMQTYYRYLSNIAVHEKGEVEPGIHEAQTGYAITLIIMDYFINRLP